MEKEAQNIIAKFFVKISRVSQSQLSEDWLATVV